jgi:hypothetical protein
VRSEIAALLLVVACQILKMRIFSYAFLKLTRKCAAMCDSQNGFAEKCAVE